MSSHFFLNFKLFLQKSLSLLEASEKQQSNNPTAKLDDKKKNLQSSLQSHLTRYQGTTHNFWFTEHAQPLWGMLLAFLFKDSAQYLYLRAPVFYLTEVQLRLGLWQVQRADGAGCGATALISVSLKRIVRRAARVPVGLDHLELNHLMDVLVRYGQSWAESLGPHCSPHLWLQVLPHPHLLGCRRVPQRHYVKGLCVFLASSLVIVRDYVLSDILRRDDQMLLFALLATQSDKQNHDGYKRGDTSLVCSSV